MQRFEVAPKTVSETRLVPCNFLSGLRSGETLVSASCSVAVYSGDDVSPSSLCTGGASISGTTVSQMTTGGNAGVIYALTFQAVTSLGQVLRMVCLLPVLADTP